MSPWSLTVTGLAYGGTQRAEVKELLEGVVANTERADITEVSIAALALGLVFVGSCDDDLGSVLLQRLMEASDLELNHTASRFICLGLGLLYLGKGERVDTVLEAVRTIEHKRGRYDKTGMLGRLQMQFILTSCRSVSLCVWADMLRRRWRPAPTQAPATC